MDFIDDSEAAFADSPRFATDQLLRSDRTRILAEVSYRLGESLAVSALK